jgi:hypothetical protein
VLIDGLARTPGTLLHRTLAGDDWSLDQHLMALAVDALRIANWQRSKDGQKGTRKPKPISPLARRGGRNEQYGKTTADPDEVKAYLGRLRRGELAHLVTESE